MKSAYSIVFFLLSLFMWGTSITYAQKPEIEKSYAMFRTEAFGGLNFNTNGWGCSFYYSKHKTAKVKRLYLIQFDVVKHPKEYKIYNPLDENSKGYVFGKMNSFATLDFGWGEKRIVYEKLRQKGVQLSLNWNFGPSVGFVKPVYLEVIKFDGLQVAGIAVEKYDPESHNLNNIYGRAPNSKGLLELKIIPGIFFKSGFNFEFSSIRDGLKAIEVGTKVNVYPRRVPIMTNVDNKFIFTEFYLCLQFGKKYI